MNFFHTEVSIQHMHIFSMPPWLCAKQLFLQMGSFMCKISKDEHVYLKCANILLALYDIDPKSAKHTSMWAIGK